MAIKVDSKFHKSVNQMTEELEKFSVSLNKVHFNKAITIFKELNSNKEYQIAQMVTPEFKVKCSQLFKGSFSFP